MSPKHNTQNKCSASIFGLQAVATPTLPHWIPVAVGIEASCFFFFKTLIKMRGECDQGYTNCLDRIPPPRNSLVAPCFQVWKLQFLSPPLEIFHLYIMPPLCAICQAGALKNLLCCPLCSAFCGF